MEGPPLGPGGEDITWPDQVAPRGRKASCTRKIKPQTSNLDNIVTEERDMFFSWFLIFDCVLLSFVEGQFESNLKGSRCYRKGYPQLLL